MLDKDKWEKPQEVQDVEIAFGGDIPDLLPDHEDIPPEFSDNHNPWVLLTSKWFFSGLGKAFWSTRTGVDQETAIRHVRAVLASFAPSHQHKEAGVAYLLHRWFKGVIAQGFRSDKEGMYLFSDAGVQKLTDEEFQALVPKQEESDDP